MALNSLASAAGHPKVKIGAKLEAEEDLTNSVLETEA